MLERLLTAVEVAVLGLWAGAMAGFAFVFAPVAIKIVPRMDTFATLIASIIRALGPFGLVCGGVAVLAAALRATAPSGRALAAVRIALVAIGLLASAYETSSVIPRMEATAAAIAGPIDSVDKSDPRRAAYDREHQTSTRVYGLAFLCVLGALGLAAFGRKLPKG
jgi:hypothetical protein